jgi:AcrR family transcriptional regulator
MIREPDEEPKGRGRPRAYDPGSVLQRAMDRFWKRGYSGTTLDELCDATNLSRSSLYAAFNDKHGLYLKALELYWRLALSAMREALADPRQGLDEALMRAYDGQLSLYFSDDGLPRGSFSVGTATIEAVEDPEIREFLATELRSLDATLEARLLTAREKGELNPDADPATLAVFASALLHTIAIRTRAGVARAELREIARKAVSLICGRPAATG